MKIQRVRCHNAALSRYSRVTITLAVAIFTSCTPGGAYGAIDTSFPDLPPFFGQYVSPAGVHDIFVVGGLTVDFTNIRLSAFSTFYLPPQNVGSSTTDPFNATFNADMSINSGPFSHVTGVAAASLSVFKFAGQDNTSLGTFHTEMLQLDISGLPGGALIRESPTLVGVGQTTISGGLPGNFHIDSFFDVFTELSLDGGVTWTPSVGATLLSVSAVPEPSSWLLWGATLLGLAATRRWVALASCQCLGLR